MQRAQVSDNFDWRSIIDASRDHHRTQSPSREAQSEYGCCLNIAGMLVGIASRRYLDDIVLKDVAQRINAVHADVGDRASAGKLGVGEPFAGVCAAGVGKL